MSKIGKYEIALEAVMTILLLKVFQFSTYERKYFVAYFVIQFLSGRYKGESLLIWDEITLLIKSHITYLFFCLLIAPHKMYSISYISRLIGMAAISFILCCVLTRYSHIWFRKICKKNVLIFGIGDTADEVDHVISGNRFTLMDVRGFVDCNTTSVVERTQEQVVDPRRTIPFSKVLPFIKKRKIDTAIFAIPEISKAELQDLINVVEDSVHTVIYTPKLEGMYTFNTKTMNFDGLMLMNSSIGPIDLFGSICKRTIDIVAGLVGTILCIPLTIFVKIYNLKCNDHGPVFFMQKRIGKNGKTFTMLKYRSMVVGAEEKLEQLMKEDPAIREEYLINKKLENDPRITKAGQFIRKTSLDEFPQFINVLLGKMSLIGPRPYLPREKEDMGEYYNVVIKTKPGITGMWQTHGRSDVSFEDRLQLDEYYYRNWNFWLDVQLTVRTVQTVLMRNGVK